MENKCLYCGGKLSLTKNPSGWRKNKNASGGDHYINSRIGKEVFIDNFGGARIMKIGSGRWDHSFKIKKNQSVKEIIDFLLKKYEK